MAGLARWWWQAPLPCWLQEVQMRSWRQAPAGPAITQILCQRVPQNPVAQLSIVRVVGIGSSQHRQSHRDTVPLPAQQAAVAAQAQWRAAVLLRLQRRVWQQQH